MVHLFSTHTLVQRLLGPGPGLRAADAEWTRSSSQSVGVGHLQANGHTHTVSWAMVEASLGAAGTQRGHL